MVGKRRAGKAAPVSENIDFASAFEALKAAIAGDPETPPIGFYTTQQWATMRAKSRVQTCRDISDLLRAGKIEKRDFRVKSDSGLVRPVPHYRLAA